MRAMVPGGQYEVNSVETVEVWLANTRRVELQSVNLKECLWSEQMIE